MYKDEQTVLVIAQTETGTPGRLGDKLRERGYTLELRRPLQGEPLPPKAGGYAGIVVLGGPMSANDEHLPGIRAELEWIPQVLDAGTPFLGICLGAQLLARTLGARVGPHPEGVAEIGYFEIQPTRDAGAVFETPMHVYHWHEEGFDLPEQTVLLAEGTCFPHQAYRYDRTAYGLQFHPEVTQSMMNDWMQEATERLVLPGAQSPDAQRAGHERHDAALDRWVDRFVDQWLD
ncbi:MAG: glutamine amidotransferase [Gammaproteobacteria bacterium]|nr:glutamine amidotransferase [Gammaproteobacteria bacterium]NIR85437.1 glutamine amidotransferase [Gammaproteobacteria bacterium]NIR89428.1 glutamine amidotransferase [Gammaproteobacteria bacterium]NIU06573.1 glutamine amidotransferase [Gammaproteobacteria bacterium]NIV53456.1 glutamine amidotransferase [Gammaproteobacteria bacterium]